MFKSPTYLTTKGKKNALINSFVHSHDLLCSCSNPTLHCLEILASEIGPQLKEQERQQIKECLGTGTTDTAAGEEDDLPIGEIEKLLEQDFTEDDTG
uniref:ORF2 n=1 Tax=TTV-like mini virus TaxID=93678 RepID=A0A4Y5QS80_9VIRU|nr:ORF2 [TTV-like mini virus]